MSNNLFHNDKTLVENVQKYPFIYDSHDRRFKSKQEKQNAWHQIGQAVNMTGPESETRFTVLRNKYCRERKMIETQGSGSEECQSRWPIFNLISFLDPYIRTHKKVLLADPLPTACNFPVEPKSEYFYKSSSNSASTQSTIDNSNHGYQILNSGEEPQPIFTFIPESIQSEPKPANQHHVSDFTNHNITKQLITTMQSVNEFIKIHKAEKLVKPNDDQFQAFGRTIAFMLTSIKDKKRQRKAMADLLMKMSEYDSDSD